MENGRRIFGWEDYTVFATMLVISALIGVYHGCRFSLKGKKKKDEPENGSPSDFLTGGGQMSVIPVALSMLARYVLDTDSLLRKSEKFAVLASNPCVSRYLIILMKYNKRGKTSDN